MNDKVVVNLGCGRTHIPGSVGVDCAELPGYVDIVHDLNQTPYPFDNSSIDELHLYHVLEHLDDPVGKLEEIHRILKEDGILYMRVPHFSSNGAFTDITHKRPFSYFSFDVFDDEACHNYYSKMRFKILRKEIKYFGQYPNVGLYEKYIHPNKCPLLVRPIVRTLNFFINLSPMLFERFWCYWVGGACEVVIDMQKKPVIDRHD
ncbi:MAG: methyltransferase domain-containing protein [Gammaproteobacteria bacterium]|nr:methyltransferase domain-containing protein [Gammaproteobacteria bacterium]